MSKPFSDPDKTQTARVTLAACGVEIGADFHKLTSAQVELLLVEANVWRYRKPRNANGSRGRYFHDMLQRRAQGVTAADARARLKA